MHDSSERRPGAGRPSLLSADQVPKQEDRSILSQLDGRSAPARAAPAPARHDHHQRGVRAAVFAIAIAGIGTLAWLAFGSVNESADASLAAAHAPTRVPPMAAPAQAAVAATSAPAPALETTPQAPAAATIQDDLTAALDAPNTSQPSPAPAAKAEQHDLASLLDAPAAAPAPALKLAQAAPSKAAGTKKPTTDKPARTEKARAPAAKPKVAQKPAAQKPASGKKSAPAVDSDVAILAALLAHTKTPEAGSPEEIYKRCATNATAAEVQRCRVRVCRGSAKGAAECKSVRISKVSSSS
ncbi:MAG: hypothetical protein AB1437_13680 [Pseudomonadota bacterium]